MHTGCLLATSGNEIEKFGPSPSGCGANRAILHSRPRRWTRHFSPRRGSASSGPIFASGVSGARFCALGLNAACGKVNNRLQGEVIESVC
jgi:hypothetical protein